MKNNISATIITYNEELNIERCLKSLTWVNEIIVVDSYSSDNTVDVCKKFKAKIIQTDWNGFGNSKKFAVDNSSNDWILSIDADEVVTDSLKEKIQGILNNPEYKGYKIKRRSHYLGKEIKHCGWDRDYPLRLFNKKYGNFNNKEVHESVIISGNKTKVEEPLMHYTYPTISSHISKMNRYTDLAFNNITSVNKYSILSSLLLGLNKFLKMYILQKGFLDGKVGFLLSINSAFGIYLKYVKIWDRKN